ncbi:MAG: hypothetical protein ACT4PE_07390 [Candidatus Eiseniibacteriota bacterium]
MTWLLAIGVSVPFTLPAPGSGPAQSWRSLGWGDTGSWTSQDLSMDCTSPTQATLVASFSAPPGIHALHGVDLNIDFCTAPYWLPEWW